MPSFTMEKDHFGVDGHATARPTNYSTDFENVLGAAGGSLHHQICEFLQRFDGEQAGVLENLQHSVRDGCFSTPAPYQPLHFLTGDTLLQTDTGISSEEHRRLPDHGLHQVLNLGSHLPSPVLRKHITVGERILPALAETTPAPPPRRRWSMDKTDHCNRNSFHLQHDALGSQRHFVEDAGTIYAQACTSNIPGEFSNLGSSSCSPTNMAATSISFQTSLSEKAEGALSMQENPLGKSKRVPDQVGHILRERLRRDDMTSKFLMLESLLPPRPKRDRATIVEHSIQLVKNLHHRKNYLQQKRTDMKKAAKTLRFNPRLARNAMATAQPLKIDKKPIKTNVVEKSGSFIENVEVHLNSSKEMLVEMTCRPHAHLQSQVFGALERLKMDVAQCSISRTRGLVLCSIVVQPRVFLDPPVTSEDIVRAVKRAITEVGL